MENPPGLTGGFSWVIPLGDIQVNPWGIPGVPWIYIPGRVPPGYPWIHPREIPHEDPPDSPWGTSRVAPQSTPPPLLGGSLPALLGVVLYKSHARRWSPQQTRQTSQM